MSGSVNKVILVGNVGRDPEVRSMQNGSKVCNLSVATSERWRDKGSGETQEKTEWHRVVVFDDRLVDVCERFVKKGAKVYLEGEIQTRKWKDQSGAEKHTTEVVLRRFRGVLTLLDTRTGGSSGESSYSSAEYREASRGGGSGPAPDSFDDEIPFLMEWR